MNVWLKEEFDSQDLFFILWELCQKTYRDGSPWSKEQFLADLNLEHSHYLILMENNQCIGFVSYHLILDQVEITHLIVNKSFQKRGYGKQLLKELDDRLRRQGIQQVFLEVRCSNIVAKKMYQKYGFEKVMIRKNYYSNPKENAIVMCLNLRK